MRLSALVESTSFPLNLVSSLEDLGIKTDADLLFGPTPLDIIRRLPPGTVSLRDLQALIAQIAEATSAKGVPVSELSSTPPSMPYLSSHCPDLDKVLGGNGFCASRVYEISGDHKTGKSILALNVALHCLLDDPQSEVVWIDTTGDFSSDLAAVVVESDRFPTEESLEVRFGALERLQVATAVDIESVHQILQVLTTRLRLNGLQHPKTRCIVIDSITPLLGPYLSPTSSQGHAIMTNFTRHLLAFARTHSVAIFVINNATAIIHGAPTQTNPVSIFLASTKKPSLGATFPYLTDATLWLSRSVPDTAGGVLTHSSVVEILRSRISHSQVSCKVKMIEGVVMGWTT